RGIEQTLLVVMVAATGGSAQVFQVLAGGPAARGGLERGRRGGDAGSDGIEQPLLPGLALHLPGAEAEEHGEGGERPEGGPSEPRLAQVVDSDGHYSWSSRPSPAAFRNWRAISVAFSSRSRRKASVKVTGPHSTAWTQMGGPILNSTSSAAP